MTVKWIFTEWGEPHSADWPADIKGYVMYPDTGALHQFGELPPDSPKETA